MKKYILALGAILLSQTGAVNAAYYNDGNVNISILPTVSMMTGSMNVRYNESSGLDYIASVHNTNTNYVTFWGRSGVTNFTCYVRPGNPLYTHAVNTHTGLKNGSVLTLKKVPGSNDCTYLSSTVNSRYMD